MITLKDGATVVSQSATGKTGKLVCLVPLEALKNLEAWGARSREISEARRHCMAMGQPVEVVRTIRYHARQHQDAGTVGFPGVVKAKKEAEAKGISLSAYYDQFENKVPYVPPTAGPGGLDEVIEGIHPTDEGKAKAEEWADSVVKSLAPVPVGEKQPTEEEGAVWLHAIQTAIASGALVEQTSAALWIYTDPAAVPIQQAAKAAGFAFSWKRTGWYLSHKTNAKRRTIKNVTEVVA